MFFKRKSVGSAFHNTDEAKDQESKVDELSRTEHVEAHSEKATLSPVEAKLKAK